MKMKRNVIIATVLVVFIVWLSACSNSGSQDKTKESTSVSGEKIVYTCTMHPEVISDKQGKCPMCGMELVKKEVKTDTVTKKSGDKLNNLKQ